MGFISSYRKWQDYGGSKATKGLGEKYPLSYLLPHSVTAALSLSPPIGGVSFVSVM